MMRITIGGLLASTTIALFFVACSGGSPASPASSGTAAAPRPAVDDGSRPATVPGEAAFIGAARTFGSDPKTPAARDGSPHLFFHFGCNDDVLVIVTTQVELYAELPCDRAIPPQVVERFLGQPVQIRVVFNDAEKLFVESPVAGSIEFTVTRAWAKE